VDYKDYYQILGLERTATPAQIKKAYRKLARELHPDKKPGDKVSEARFKEVNEANEVLSDPQKRTQYDEMGQHWDRFSPPPPPPPRSAAGSGPQMHYEFAGDEDFSDFFQMFFGGSQPFGGRQPFGDSQAFSGRTVRHQPQPEHLQVEAEISLEEVLAGAARLVQIGSRRLEVKIPAGVTEGSRVRLAGKGTDGGDLYLIVKIASHPIFTRAGVDLSCEVPVTLAEALLGDEIEVTTLRGRVKLKIPAGTQPGQVFRLSGQGLPHLRSSSIGHLLVKIKVILPERLEGNAREAAVKFIAQIAQSNPRLKGK
jgi:curved DNA-binding protein